MATEFYSDLPVTDESTRIAGAKAAKAAAKKLTTAGLKSFKEAEAAALPPAGDSGGGGDTKTITGTKDNGDGTYTVTYSDGTSEIKGTKITGGKKTVDTTAQDNRVSAFNILKDEFDKYGLGLLVEGIRGLLTDGTPASEFALRLRQTPQYKARFSANEDRIKAGLAALSPAEYVAMEDQYQNLMRNYGLPKSYYEQSIDPVTGVKKQSGFDKLLGADVSAVELEDRIATAQQRVLNSNPEVLKALRQFYPDISNADILAYTLDPQNGLDNIKRKVTAAEIGGAALANGLQANGASAEALAGQGVTGKQYSQAAPFISEAAQRGSELTSFYNQGPYGQAEAEAEALNTVGGAQAARKRKNLTELETAQFSGSSGVGALSRDRATNYGTTQSGFGAY